MCVSNGLIGKLNSLIDPKNKLDPLNLFTNKRLPDPPPPPKMPQMAKAPNTMPLKRRNTAGDFASPNGSTALTGPSGSEMAQMNLGAATALG